MEVDSVEAGVGGAAAADEADDACSEADAENVMLPIIQGGEGFAFWDSITWEDILHLRAPTTPLVPRGVAQAVAQRRADVSREIRQAAEAARPQDEERAWKAFLALDVLLFSGIKGTEGHSRRAQVADRLLLMEGGHWAALWAGLDGAPPAAARADPEEHAAARVRGLLEAGEVSRAASAVWGDSGSATATAVVRKFKSTQPAARPADGPVAPASPEAADELRTRVAAQIAKGYNRFGRRSSAGPAGARFEH
jgi:hypothetical protein